MAYVFGIEGVPIFELLSVLSLLLLAGLIFVLLEVRRLRGLIGKEKSDLGIFESDLKEFEEDEKQIDSMSKQQPNKLLNNSEASVVEYVRAAIRKGVPILQIEHAFLEKGWTKERIDKIILQAQK